MAQPGLSNPEPPAGTTGFLRRLFGRGGASSAPPAEQSQHATESTNGTVSEKPGLMRRVSRKVVPGLPRVQTFKRQQSEKRTNLAPVKPTPAERRAVSVDRRVMPSRTASQTDTHSFPRASAPELLGAETHSQQPIYVPSLPASPVEEHEYAPLDPGHPVNHDSGIDVQADSTPYGDTDSVADTRSITSAQIHDDLEKKWILNLSMHFRDKSKREKFFVTFREHETVWRRVTISLDYRGAPENSLEADLLRTKFQRDKSAKIYEAIRESLEDIQFYDTVTNLKLQTTDGRLHVHVVEDVNEIIEYPTVRQVRHLACRRVREKDISFDSHMSGFVYKVTVGGEKLIKKEIPGPDTIEEFLYEINALNSLRFSSNVIRFYGLVVDDQDEFVKGLLIDFADQGALIDVIFDHRQEAEAGNLGAALPWSTRVKWARQVVQGLADIHESGFVQGDFTLSNIVINDQGDAKIIDMNRRGCPVGWEPPEATPLIEGNQRISMYIGVKSDLYQLGMVLWALAVEDDEPEAHGRPLVLGDDVLVPEWYRQMMEICLSDDPRLRLQASSLLSMFPPEYESEATGQNPPPCGSDKRNYLDPYAEMAGYQANGDPRIRTVSPSNRWAYGNIPQVYDPSYLGYEPPFTYPTRGRSPPSPLPSNSGYWDGRSPYGGQSWSRSGNMASYSDAGDAVEDNQDRSKSITPTKNNESTVPVGETEIPDPASSQSVAEGTTPVPVEAKEPASVEDASASTRAAAVEVEDGGPAVPEAVVEPVSKEEVAPSATEPAPEESESRPESGPGPEEQGVPASEDEGKQGVGNKLDGGMGKEACISPELGNTEPVVQTDSNKGEETLPSTTDKPGEAIEPVEQAETSAPVEPVKSEPDAANPVEASEKPEASATNEFAETSAGEEKRGEKKADDGVEGTGQEPTTNSDETPRPPSPCTLTDPPNAEVLQDTLSGVGAAHDQDKTDLLLMGLSTSLEEELGLLGTTQKDDST